MTEEEIADLFPEKAFKIKNPNPIQLLLPSLKSNGTLIWSQPQYYHHSEKDMKRFNKIYDKALTELNIS